MYFDMNFLVCFSTVSMEVFQIRKIISDNIWRVWHLTPALVLQTLAYGNTERHKSKLIFRNKL